MVIIRPVFNRLDNLAPYRSRPDLLRYRLLYKLVYLALGNTLRFLFYYRALYNSPYNKRTSRDYRGRLSFLSLTSCFMPFRMLCIRFYSVPSYDIRSIPRCFYFLFFRWFFIYFIIFF